MMRFSCRRLAIVAGLALAATGGGAGAAGPPRGSRRQSTRRSAKVAPSLVRIHVVTVNHTDGREIKREASGSGTIITPKGTW